MTVTKLTSMDGACGRVCVNHDVHWTVNVRHVSAERILVVDTAANTRTRQPLLPCNIRPHIQPLPILDNTLRPPPRTYIRIEMNINTASSNPRSVQTNLLEDWGTQSTCSLQHQ